ncbi:MAG: glutamine synthetase [Hyphomicrobiales bacterium]|nr:glutamine synthetase [Hyphomicrobiales bacterium]
MGRPDEFDHSANGIGEPAEVAAYLADNPEPEIVEVLIPDTNGLFRGKWLPGATLDKIYSGNFAMPLSIFGLDVWGREVLETGMHLETGDKDGVCLPVCEALRPVPWSDRPAAQVLASMWSAPQEPFYADPRHRLAAIVDRFAEKGLTPVVAFELEFYLTPKGAAEGEPVLPVYGERSGPEWQNMYGLSDLADFKEVFDDIRIAAERQGIPADAIVSEAAPGQFEVNLKHRDDALAGADDALLLRRLICAVADRRGLRATFMAKPFIDWPGNGMHVHVSLCDRSGQNIFGAAEGGEDRLSETVAGLIQTMPAALPLFISSWNGYRRIQPGSYAPTRATWGHNNRSVAVRIPAAEGSGRRIEHRISGADANPYLVLAGVLAGMLHGLDHGLRPPAPVDGNAYDEPCPMLARDMKDALHTFEHADFIRHAFGADFRKIFTDIKRAEMRAFESEITPLERATYL